MDNREKDIQEICRQMMHDYFYIGSLDHNYDDVVCKRCKNIGVNGSEDPSTIKHADNCTYVLALDLSTGMQKNPSR